MPMSEAQGVVSTSRHQHTVIRAGRHSPPLASRQGAFSDQTSALLVEPAADRCVGRRREKTVPPAHEICRFLIK